MTTERLDEIRAHINRNQHVTSYMALELVRAVEELLARTTDLEDIIRCIQAAYFGEINGIPNDLRAQLFRASAALGHQPPPEEAERRCAVRVPAGFWPNDEACGEKLPCPMHGLPTEEEP